MYIRNYIIAGKVSDQWNMEGLKTATSVYRTKGVAVGVSNAGLTLPAGQHIHSEFEFIVPLYNTFLSKIEKTDYPIEKLKINPLNTEQYHGPRNQTHLNKFVAITIEREYLRNLSYDIFGKERILFQNGSYEYGSKLRDILNSIMEEGIYKQAGYLFMRESLSNMLAVTILRDIPNNMPKLPEAEERISTGSLKHIIEYMTEYYNSEFSLADIASIAGLSPWHFIRVFKSSTGKTPYSYLLEIKVNKAKELLALNNMSVTEVCFACGFNNLSHFTGLFKRLTGLTPSSYRKQLFHM